jgi:hypothetical protein
MAAITDTTGDPAVRHRSSHSPMISHGPPSPVLLSAISAVTPMGGRTENPPLPADCCRHCLLLGLATT